MAMSRPLLVGVVAFGLLAASVGFEVIFHRTFYVEVHDAAGWQVVGESRSTSGSTMPIARQDHAVLVTPNGSVEFRVRVDNGYPWAYSHHYDVVGGSNLLVASGTLAASARDVGESTFTVPVGALYGLGGGPPKETGTNVTFAYFTVQIGSTIVSANLQVQEAAA